jgi:hypothetical protein
MLLDFNSIYNSLPASSAVTSGMIFSAAILHIKITPKAEGFQAASAAGQETSNVPF